MVGVGPNYWRQSNEIKFSGNIEIITHLNGVRGSNWRIPNIADPTKGGMHWCGIFATWCWIQAGVPTKWPFGGPPLGVIKRAHNQEHPSPKPGDILVQGGSVAHHSLLRQDFAGANNCLVVNGNSDFQSVLIKPISRKSVVAVYSIENFAGNGYILCANRVNAGTEQFCITRSAFPPSGLHGQVVGVRLGPVIRVNALRPRLIRHVGPVVLVESWCVFKACFVDVQHKALVHRVKL